MLDSEALGRRCFRVGQHDFIVSVALGFKLREFDIDLQMIVFTGRVDYHAAVIVGVDSDVEGKRDSNKHQTNDQGFCHQKLYQNDMWNQSTNLISSQQQLSFLKTQPTTIIGIYYHSFLQQLRYFQRECHLNCLSDRWEQFLTIQSQMSRQLITSNRQPHYSPNMVTHSQHDSTNDLGQPNTSRKMSSSLSKKGLDMDKLIGDVKITPVNNKKSTQIVANIRQQLEGLKDQPRVIDEVKAIELLLNSLLKKLAFDGQTQTYSNVSHMKSSSKSNHNRIGSVSPIKQFEDMNSHIVYTNFSIKAMENSSNKCEAGLSTQRSIAEPQELQTPIKRALFDENESQEIERINSEIKMLEKILQSKGIDQRISQRQHLGVHDSNKKNVESISGSKHKYMQSENLCPAFRKNSRQQSNHPKSGLAVIQGKGHRVTGSNLR